MTLKRLLPILVMFATILMMLGCSREQPATREQPAETAAPSTQETTSVRTGAICDTVVAGTSGPPPPPQRTRRTQANLPKLVDLGRGTCIPCKKMAPILEELSREYEGRAIVEVIDLRYSPQAAMEYGIKLIPTQVFFDGKGAEVWRHEGFLAKDQIVAKFQEMGVEAK